MGSDELLEERRDDIVILLLNRPERRNALTSALARAIVAACVRVRADRSVRALVVGGTGGAFCAGLDLQELTESGANYDAGFIDALRAVPQPTIAAVDGPAVTGGLELALACDLRLGSPRARFADTHARLGVAPGGGATVLLPRIVGPGRAKELSLSGRYLAADEAERWGLLNRVVPQERLLDEAVSLAAEIAANPANMVDHVKRVIDDGMDLGVDQALDLERQRWHEVRAGFSQSDVAARRDEVVRRGRLETRDA